jgi:predicted Zn finger-like uncharacterized protein
LCSATSRIAKPPLDLRHEAAEGRDMNIACPICDASYEVPESVLAAHRPLRCARCGHDWIPGGAAPEPAPEPVSTPETVAEMQVAAPAPEPEEEFDEYVAAKEPETITAADLALATELADEVVTEPAQEAAHPDASFVPPRPIAPRPTLSSVALPPETVQPRRAWGASLIILALLIVALVIFHAPITRAWQPMGRLYGLFGI